MSISPRIIVTELSALLPVQGESDAAHSLPASALEQLGRAQHTGARLYVLAEPVTRSDGADLDALLARCERVARQLQDAGSRLDGALLPEAGSDAPSAISAALADLCQRQQCQPEQLEIVAASESLRQGAAAAGATKLLQAAPGQPFPYLGVA